MRIVTFVLFIIIGLSACKKTNDDRPAALGSISGRIDPAHACASLSAKNIQTNFVYNGSIDVSGSRFSFSDLPAGAYDISFIAAGNFVSPSNISTSVSGNNSIDVGTIVFKPLQGSISGKLSITGILSPVRAQVINPPTALESIPDPNGNFKFSELYGYGTNYTISFPLVPGYKIPDDRNVILATGQQVDLGTIEYIRHMISFKYNGINFPSLNPIGINCSFPDFRVEASRTNIDNGSSQRLTIVLDNVTGPGIYTCTGSATSNITYSSKAPLSPLPATYWNTSGSGGSGMVTITAVDAARKTITGNFSARLIRYSGSATGDIIISEGTFDFVYP